MPESRTLPKPIAGHSDIFVGSSEMAALMRAKDWSQTPLGPPERWPEALKVALRILLTSRFEMWLGWGPEIAFFYNDAYRPTLGLKHPESLAKPTKILWAEIWDDIEARIRSVYEDGEATWDRGLLLLLERNGYPEETYHTFSYSPVLADDGTVGGLFCAVSEETNRVISERRLGILRLLGESLARAESRSDVLRAVEASLGEARRDLPFSAIHLYDGGSLARLAAATGMSADHAALPEVIDPAGPLADLLDGSGHETIVDLDPAQNWPTGDWARPPAQAVSLPLVGQGGSAPLGIVTVGLNPHRPIDADYLSFLKLLAGQISSSLASVSAYEAERERNAVLAEAVRMRQEAAEALRQANEALLSEVRQRTAERDRMRTLFQDAPGFMCVLSGPSHVFEYTNEAYLQLVGHRDIIGIGVREALPEVEGQGFFELLDEVYATGRPFIGRNMPVTIQAGQDGGLEQRILNLVYQPITEADGSVTGIFAEGHDVTDRALAEDALRRLNETLEQQVQARTQEVQERTQERDRAWRLSQDLLMVTEADSRIAAINTAWTTLLGWTSDDLAGRSFADLAHPDDRDAVCATFSAIVAEPLTDPFEFRLRHADGSYRWFAWTGAFEDGRIYASGRNTTAEREQAAALALAEDALRQAQKMEAVGQLTGGIAHDFNNLLTGIVGSLDLMQTRLSQGRMDNIERYAKAAMSSANRAAALTHRLLAFARRQPLDPKLVDANALIASLEDLLRRTIGETISLDIVMGEGLWATLCDPHQLENAILNLAINARDAMPDGGRLRIETSNSELDRAYARLHPGVEPGAYVRIVVSDTGTGMPADVIARAFDPFFTTKPLGQGTGLGLSMIYGFARQSDGHAKIDSQVGHGTAVKLYLPRSVEAVPEPGTADTITEAARLGAGETVLVVEDEGVVRDLIVDVLEDLGYRAISAPDGLSGLKILLTQERVDLLVTDVGLPGLNGRQLADQARETRPNLKVLFITGYAENAIFGNGQLDPGMQMITKPFPVEILAGRIREMMET
ncbi:Sensor histidine kinase RcsC [Methylobacterium bullatum]|uniref:histidine kinase n=2 Tax=Methylobacterium bullatum TaxID=570505 RepID=A0AAV4Z6M1_9HYPH|nr:Sensor histidine kinase RcsC [Methylobacterium bullatum]